MSRWTHLTEVATASVWETDKGKVDKRFLKEQQRALLDNLGTIMPAERKNIQLQESRQIVLQEVIL